MLENVTVNLHSSIQITGLQKIYIDPYKVPGQPEDADLIFITHPHYDHFSPEDIRRVQKPGTLFVAPETMRAELEEAGLPPKKTTLVAPGDRGRVGAVGFEALPAYNREKAFHPRQKGWVGYLLALEGVRYYICGDTDPLPKEKTPRCDVGFFPVGGTYTMDAPQAAAYANAVRPRFAVPVHYGSVVGSEADARRFGALLDKEITLAVKIKA